MPPLPYVWTGLTAAVPFLTDVALPSVRAGPGDRSTGRTGSRPWLGPQPAEDR